MRFVDVPNPQQINRKPDNNIVILADGKIMQEDVEIKQIELLEYKIKNDENLGQYSIITALIGDLTFLPALLSQIKPKIKN